MNISAPITDSITGLVCETIDTDSDMYSPTFDLKLLKSIVPTKGAAPATFTRSTTASVTDFEGIVHTAKINELRFPNARRVENLLSNTEILSTQTVTVVSGASYILSFSGTGTVTLSGSATGTLSGEVGTRVEVSKTMASTSLTLTVTGSVLQAMLEQKIGTQTEASEYVSSGVLSSPFHGAYVDNVKYFGTDRSGSVLTNLKGALIELLAINLFLNSNAPVTQIITVVSGTIYTVWGTGTGSVVLSGAGTGTVTANNPLTFTASSTTLTCTVASMLTMQAEAGSAKTSYIPTAGATVTRTADLLYYTVTDVITQGRGSLYAEFTYKYSTGFPRVLELNFGSNTYISIRITTAKLLGVIVQTTSVTQVNINTASAISNDLTYKVLVTYEDNNVNFYVNGELIGTDTLGTIPINIDKLFIGSNLTTAHLNGSVRNIKYFSKALTESQAKRITTT